MTKRGKYSAIDIARYVVNYSWQIKSPISNLKLQKLLYFIQGNFLRNLARPCFYENIEAWKFGPVVPEVYREFRVYGSNDIPRVENYDYFQSDKYRPIKKHFDINLLEEEEQLINDVIDACANYSSSYLVELTHNQSPWIDSYNGYRSIISLQSMEEYFCD